MSPSTTTNTCDILKAELSKRIERNPNYSLRSFARFLEMPVSTLSTLISGETNPTLTTIKKLASKLSWSLELVESLKSSSKTSKRTKSEKLNGRRVVKPSADLLSSLAPLSLLTLAKTGLLEADAQILAIALGMPVSEIEQALATLLNHGFVKIDPKSKKLKEVLPTPVVIEDPDGPIMKNYVANWLTHASQQVLDSSPTESNAILMQIVAAETQLPILRSKFEAFARSIRKAFPLNEATGDLYSIGAVVFPFKKTRSSSQIESV